MDFNLFLSALGWFGFVFFLVKLLIGVNNYRYFNSLLGRLELAAAGARIKSYGIQNNLIGFAVCIALLVALG